MPKDHTNLRVPVPMAGVDADNHPRIILTGPDGSLQITGVAGAAIPTAPGASTSTTAATLEQGTKLVASAGTPEPLVGVSTKVESVLLFAQKAVGTANTGNVYVGFSATPGANLSVLGTATMLGKIFEAPAGKKIDLHDIYVDAANSGDGVMWESLN